MALQPGQARLIENLLTKVPQRELAEIIKALEYYNSRFHESDRARALRNGSKNPSNEERAIQESIKKALGQEMYLSSNALCPCCLR